jgi:hypothetical protein
LERNAALDGDIEQMQFAELGQQITTLRVNDTGVEQLFSGDKKTNKSQNPADQNRHHYDHYVSYCYHYIVNLSPVSLRD